MVATARRVSYILPSPSDPPPLLALPSLGQARRGQTSPLLEAKAPGTASSPAPNILNNGGPASPTNWKSKNPFLTTSPPEEESNAGGNGNGFDNHPKHCLGLTSLAIDTSTLLSNSASPGGILYSGGRDGLIASWELNVPHRRRKGGRYEIPAGRGSRVKWERIGDGAEFWDDEDEEDGFEESDDILSSDDDEGGWGAEGKRRSSKGEVPYEDRWEVDKAALSQVKVGTCLAPDNIEIPAHGSRKPHSGNRRRYTLIGSTRCCSVT